MKIDLYTKIIQKGFISSELELEKVAAFETKLRLMARENPDYTIIRNQLRELIKEYEKLNWSTRSDITERQIAESDLAEVIVQREQFFLNERQNIIKKKLKALEMNQQDLGIILGHSKSYMSELINGVNPFSLKDLVVIHNLLDIKLEYLIPTTIPQKESSRIKSSFLKLNRPKLKLEKSKLELI